MTCSATVEVTAGTKRGTVPYGSSRVPGAVYETEGHWFESSRRIRAKPLGKRNATRRTSSGLEPDFHEVAGGDGPGDCVASRSVIRLTTANSVLTAISMNWWTGFASGSGG